MSGHSKWATIKRKKGANDAKRGILFTRLSKDITLAARQGGGDESMNPALRLAVKSAKTANMPNANIDRAIKKGTGDLPGQQYESYVYEGYGPGGVAIMIDVFTDNKKRTIPEIRHILTKNGGNLGESGCVAWMFEQKGLVSIEKEGVNEEQLFEDAIEFGADDLDSDDEMFFLTCGGDAFNELYSGLERKGYNIDSGELNLEAANSVSPEADETGRCEKLIELLDEHDDVQKVYHNLEYAD